MVTMLMPYHQRLAELSTIKKQKRKFTVQEESDYEYCLYLNESFAWKIANLENLSLVASMTNDYEWQHEICAQIELLQGKE
jgi:hypothetical protein